MVGAWIGIVIGALMAVIGVTVIVARKSRPSSDGAMSFLIGGVILVVGLCLAGGCAFWLYGTEAGARAQKSWASQTGGGLTRVVTVYDMEGDEIKRYEGTFDVDASEERIIFDMPQPDGTYKRVQIWSSTGTVTIEEK